MAGSNDGNKIGAEDFMPVFRCSICKESHLGNPGVIDQAVNGAEISQRFADHSVCELRTADIAGKRQTGNASVPDLFLQGMKIPGVVESVDDNVPAIGSEAKGRGPANSAGTAGN